jgi:para-aminobenzoate synthetase/4-amino-4-deoxychorismate lyase
MSSLDFDSSPLLLFPAGEGRYLFLSGAESVWPGERLEQAEDRAARIGGHLGGGLRYGPAEKAADGFWAVFPKAEELSSRDVREMACASPTLIGGLEAGMDARAYADAFAVVREALARGDCYQANLTFNLAGKACSPGPWSVPAALRLWIDLVEPGGDRNAGQGRHASFAVSPAGEIIASLSPELFFSIRGGAISARPMKGTAARDPDPARDEEKRRALLASPKNRAENLMILDMMRNDLGRIAVPGSVEAVDAFAVEAYPSLWQMTSGVKAELPAEASLAAVMRALFPCASVTGAPKVSSQEIIAEAENRERGWYTGCMGWSRPAMPPSGGRQAEFSVLIRSLVFPRPGDPAFSLGVGGGIVWDSDAEGEYAEALLKAEFARPARRGFDLTEAMLWEPGSGFFLLERHRTRLSRACRAFGGTLDGEAFLRAALSAVKESPDGDRAALKVRVLAGPDCSVRARAEALDRVPEPLRCAISKRILGPESLPYRLFKTSERGVYSGAAEAGLDQLVFLNERGELTESTSMNIVLRLGGRLATPAASSGLLRGTFREALLEEGIIEEKTLYEADLRSAEEFWLVNSVRRWVRAALVGGE